MHRLLENRSQRIPANISRAGLDPDDTVSEDEILDALHGLRDAPYVPELEGARVSCRAERQLTQ